MFVKFAYLRQQQKLQEPPGHFLDPGSELGGTSDIESRQLIRLLRGVPERRIMSVFNSCLLPLALFGMH